jgi:hypothetical protein
MSARRRCSNCEKSVEQRTKEGYITISKFCKATGEKIANSKSNPNQNSPYYKTRKCMEFIPKPEYINQFENPIDRAIEMIDKGKRIKDILDPM